MKDLVVTQTNAFACNDNSFSKGDSKYCYCVLVTTTPSQIYVAPWCYMQDGIWSPDWVRYRAPLVLKSISPSLWMRHSPDSMDRWSEFVCNSFSSDQVFKWEQLSVDFAVNSLTATPSLSIQVFLAFLLVPASILDFPPGPQLSWPAVQIFGSS